MKFTDTKIRALDKQVSKEDSFAPKLPFSCQITGGKGSGKSSLLTNLLLNPHLLKGKFNRILWVSPTARLDAKLDILKTTPGITKVNQALIKKMEKTKRMKILDHGTDEIPEYITHLTDDDFIPEVSLDILNDLIQEQRVIIEAFGKEIADNILVIFDDIAAETKFLNSISTKRAVYNSRHYKLSLIFVSQAYHAIPKPIRLNSSILILFETANKKELETIYSENNGRLSFENFYQIYRKVMETPYAFLTINYQNSNEKRYLKSLEEYIMKK